MTTTDENVLTQSLYNSMSQKGNSDNNDKKAAALKHCKLVVLLETENSTVKTVRVDLFFPSFLLWIIRSAVFFGRYSDIHLFTFGIWGVSEKQKKKKEKKTKKKISHKFFHVWFLFYFYCVCVCGEIVAIVTRYIYLKCVLTGQTGKYANIVP